MSVRHPTTAPRGSLAGSVYLVAQWTVLILSAVALAACGGSDDGLLSDPVQTVATLETSASGITLATRILDNGRVRLDWSGAAGSRVDIEREGTVHRSTKNDGATTDKPPSQTGSYLYRICEQATELCSNYSTVVYGGTQAPTADPGGPYSGEIAVPVQFDGTGSSDPEGPIESYAWDFGDGSATGTGAQSTHTYADPDAYIVTLTVTDAEGLSSDPVETTATIMDPNVNQAPTSDPGGPYTGEIDVAVAFDGTGSSDLEGPIQTYAWDFGDESPTGTGAEPTHTYTTAGTFTVTLTVTDEGELPSEPVQTTANITDPSSSPVTLATRILANGRVRLDWSGATGPRVDIERNGVIDRSTRNDGATTDSPPTRTGSYAYRICERGGTGLCSNVSTAVYSGNQPPTADPGGPYSTDLTDPIQFDGTGSSDPEGPVQSYAWDFGDDSAEGSGPEPTHSYADPGVYTVTLTVTDADGLVSDPVTTTATSNGAQNQPPVADAGGPYQTTDGAISVDGSASDDPDGPNGSLTYAWTFGDGGTSSGATATHQYAEPGTYTVTLIVTDEGGLDSAPASTQAVFTEEPNQPPVANAGGPYTTTDGTVQLDGSASDDPDGPNGSLTYAWDFGDGGPAGAGVNPTHGYAQFGTFTVSLVVTDEEGAASEPHTTSVTYLDDGGSGGGGVRTSSQSGAWGSPSTWGGQSVPGVGDQALVQHAVTVNGHVTLGQHSPGGGTVDLDVRPGGALTLSSGASLRVRGNIEYAGRIRVEEGASLLQDAPAGSVYYVNVQANSPLDATLEVRGSAGNPGTIDLNAGQGTGVLAPDFIVGNGLLDFEYGIFRGGDADNLNRVQIRGGQHFRLINSRVENSAGIFQHNPISRGGRVTVENSTWIGTVTSESLRLNRWDDPSTPGTTRFIHSVFDQRAFIEGPDALIDGCYLAEGLTTTAGATVLHRVVQNSLVRRTSQSFMNITGDYLNNVHLEDYTTSNPHGVQVNLNAVSSTIRGNVFKYTGTSSAGDLIAPRSTNPSPVSMVVAENLVLPNGNGSGPSGTLVSLLGDRLWTVWIERNTYPVLGSSGGIAIAETYTGHAGYVPSINSNLAVGMTSGTGSVVHETHTGVVTGYVTEALRNGYHNLATPYDAPGHAFGSPPGAGDVAADPVFADPTRDLARFDLVHGGNGTVAHLLSEVARMNDSGFNAAFEPSNIRSWIRAGFRPQNPAFRGAGKGGVDIGAVPY